jgi:predicted signal transduction protein with EAL and GGDEF domain
MLNSGRHDREFYAAVWRALTGKGHWHGEIRNRRKDGALYAEMFNISAVCDGEGQTQHHVGLFSDITSLKEHQRQLGRIAHYDALTGLPNRVLLADRLQQAIVRTRRRENIMALVYLDLDGFKAINDGHGHETGDELLVVVASRLKAALERSEFVLHYQPRVNMRSGAVLGAEALIRWQIPEHGLLAPGDFLPGLEDSELSVRIGDWVLDAALAQMAAWRRAGLDIAVSVNVAAHHLQQDDFSARLQHKLGCHPDMRAGRLELTRPCSGLVCLKRGLSGPAR